MKKLNAQDIQQMADTAFIPDYKATRRDVNAHLKLAKRILPEPAHLPQCVTLDLHMHTEEQAWGEIMEIAKSGVRNAKIITGASGILKIKFQQWAQNSMLSPYIVSITPINNGSFSVKFKKN